MSELWTWVPSLASMGHDELVTLVPDEARHVSARRLRLGDALVVFDGCGLCARGRIESLGNRTTLVCIEEILESPQPAASFILASAIPKGDRLGTMLQMLAQLGLEVWQPLVLEDSVIRKIDPESPRLRRILIESAKVARRPWLLDIRPACSLDVVLENHCGEGRIFYGDRGGLSTGFDEGAQLLVVGPEAGFRDAERGALEAAGAEARSFGFHNLRIETAAVAAVVARNLARKV